MVRVLEAYKQALRRRDQGLPAPAPGHRRRGRGRAPSSTASSSSTPININFEHKKLFPGNLGPSTGEMGTSMFWSGPTGSSTRRCKKMEPRLAEERYVGYIDLNCIVNANGIYPLEFTSRFGYPTIFIQQEGMITPIGQFLSDLAAGRESRSSRRRAASRSACGSSCRPSRSTTPRPSIGLEERGHLLQEGRRRKRCTSRT